MAGFITAGIIGIVCIIIGITNMKGNISSLHSYHRHRVSEEDRLPFGRAVGLGTVIIGVSIIISSILSSISLICEKDIFSTVGMVILGAGLLVGLIISFRAMIKYNKGIF